MKRSVDLDKWLEAKGLDAPCKCVCAQRGETTMPLALRHGDHWGASLEPYKALQGLIRLHKAL